MIIALLTYEKTIITERRMLIFLHDQVSIIWVQIFRPPRHVRGRGHQPS